MNIRLLRPVSHEQRVAQMREDARFEVAWDADAQGTALRCAADITAPPAPAKVPKVFVSGSCVFNCAYCGCRCSREDKTPYCHTPRETAALAADEARLNGRGVFISSAIWKNPDYTQELIAESARILREEHFYSGFLHAKVMPGADPLLIRRTGRYADRLSINIEVARSSGYARIAKQKNRANILRPMAEISRQIAEARAGRQTFASSQTTQLMAGSTGEDDRTIMTLSRALYDKYHLKRVYYTAFRYSQEALGYEDENLALTQTPYWRMARLYQADRLLQLYGFTPDDVTPEDAPLLRPDMDPKSAWALRHLSMYPVEVNTADYETLLRVPGIGVTYARRILEARRHCALTHDVLRKMGVSLKRSGYFITCGGRAEGPRSTAEEALYRALSTGEEPLSIADTLEAGACG